MTASLSCWVAHMAIGSWASMAMLLADESLQTFNTFLSFYESKWNATKTLNDTLSAVCELGPHRYKAIVCFRTFALQRPSKKRTSEQNHVSIKDPRKCMNCKYFHRDIYLETRANISLCHSNAEIEINFIYRKRKRKPFTSCFHLGLTSLLTTIYILPVSYNANIYQ